MKWWGPLWRDGEKRKDPQIFVDIYVFRNVDKYLLVVWADRESCSVYYPLEVFW